MTYLNLDVRGKLTLGFLCAVGCSSRVQIANDATGGQSAQYTGGSSAIGGSSPITVGGGPSPTGGNHSGTGGVVGAGGTGGNPPVGGAGGVGGFFCCVAPSGGYQEIGGMAPIGGSNAGGSLSNTGGEPSGGYQATGGYDYHATGGVPGVGGAHGTLPSPGCTFGADQTCTDDVTVSAVVGHCEADGWCTCTDPDSPNPYTGKCNTPDQFVCYSPTQNIDNAYVNRAFGCHCKSTTPFCGIDSSGLRVYLVCTGGNWQSGDTSNCKS